MEKRIFKEKLINQEGVIISDQGRSPGGIFAATALNGARFFFPIFFTLRTLQNSLVEALCSWKSCFLVEKARQKKGFGKRKRKQKENRSKEERKRTILVKTRKIPLWKRLVLAELHAGAQISDKEVASNYNLKAACRFVVLLLSTFCGFPFLPWVLPLPFRNFAHYCAALLNAPMSDRDKKRVFSMGYFSREIFILRYWRQDQWNLRLSAHRRNHDSTLDWMLWESERVFNSRVFRYNEMQSLFPIVMKLRKKREEPKLYSI